MIRIVAENFIKPEHRERFLELARELVDGTRAEAGNISYKLHTDMADGNHFTFIEEWKDEAAIKAHNESAHFTRIVPQFAPLKSKEGICYLYRALV